MPKITLEREKRVYEAFDGIDEDELYVRANRCNNDYWESVGIFWDQVREKPVSFLSERQRAWVEKIEQQLGESDD